MGIADWSEDDLRRFVARLIEAPRVERTQAADARTDIDQLRADVDSMSSGGTTPTGPAGGDLSGSYPNPGIAPEAIVNADVSASAAIDQSKINGLSASLAGKVSAADLTAHENDTTGVHGITDTSDLIVEGDSRLTDDRDPTVHAASHKDGGSDELKLHELGEPTANVDFNGWELEHVGNGTQADSGVNLSQLDLVRMGFTVRPQADFATVQALDSYTGSGTGTLEASSNGDLLDALGLESEHWDYSLTFFALGTPHAIATDGTYFYVTFTIGGNHRVWKFDSSGQSVPSFSGAAVFGANGSGNGQFGGPCYGICVDSSGNIYVADSSNYRIQKFNSSGVYQAQVGSLGSGNGQFGYYGPHGLGCDSSNNIYAVDPTNYRVQKFNSSLTYQAKAGAQGSGNGEFDFDGYAMAANIPVGLAVDGSNNVFVVDSLNERVQKFNASLSYQSQFGVAADSFGVATDPSGNVYVVGWAAGRVSKYNSSGTFVAGAGASGSAHGQFSGPTDVAVDSSGNLYVADNLNARVEKLLFVSAAVNVGQSVIVKDQAFSGPHVDHGVFDITATGGPSSKWELTRREDVDNGSEIMSGLLVNAKRRGPNVPGGMWYVSTPDPITIDTTPITFEQFQPGGPPSAHGFQHVHDGSDPIPVEDWIEIGSGGAPAFQNSWTNVGSGWATAAFYKDPFGIVHLKGYVGSGTLNTIVFTLPTGYGPAQSERFSVTASGNTTGSVQVWYGGTVRVITGSTSGTSLDGISFRAAT